MAARPVVRWCASTETKSEGVALCPVCENYFDVEAWCGAFRLRPKSDGLYAVAVCSDRCAVA